MSSYQRRQAIRQAYADEKIVTYNGEKVYADGVLVYTTDEPQDDEPADEDKIKLWMYEAALDELVQEHQKYRSNANMWFRWDNAMRLWWITQIEGQAARGQGTIGTEVVARAVAIRLTRTMEST